MIGQAQFLFPQDSANQRCGCYLRNPQVLNLKYGSALVPLRQINYNLQIVNSLLNINLVQKYINPSDKFLQVDYSLPINPQSSIYRFSAQFGNVIIQGIVKQKEQAKKEYQKAKNQGRQVAIGTIDADSHDILNMEIGNIPPKTQFTIRISLLQQMKISLNTFYKLHIPSTISPRYMNKIQEVLKVPEHMRKKGQSNINPDYKWTFSINLRTSHKIIFHNSPSHKIVLNTQNQTLTQSLFQIEHSQKPNKDFTFLYTTENFQLPSYVLGNTDLNSTVMLSLIPKFCSLNLNDAYKAQIQNKPYETNLSSAKGEYVFFLDRSGSMSGTRIQKAKQALILFLKSLPEDSYFNIISFGDTSQRIFGKSAKYNANQIQKSIKKIQVMSADMGGTQIYQSLVGLLNQKIINGYPRQVFLLTDGGVSNTQGVIKMVQKNTKYCRVHCIGIGNGASIDLIQGCAKSGKGKHILISDSQNPSQKIIQLLETALTPVIDKINLKISNQKDIQSIVPNPKSIPYILKDDIINFYITFKRPLAQQIVFQFQYEDSVTKLPYKSEIKVSPDSINMPFVDKMAHFKVLRSLENSADRGISIQDQMYYVKIKDFKQQAIKYSIKHQILSEFTSFLCISKQLVDGQYQQFQTKGIQKVHVQQYKPIQYAQSYSYRGASNIGSRNRSANLCQIEDRCDNLKMCSMSFNHKAKKSSGFSLNLGVGDFFSSVGQKISAVFTKKPQSRSKKLQNDMIIQSQCKEQATEPKIPSRKTDSSSPSVDINAVVKLQQPNGSWSELDLIDKLCKNSKQIKQLIKSRKYEADLIVTKLVVKWINKYHFGKQYTLIVKKAINWIVKWRQQKGIPQKQLQELQEILCI